MDRGETMRKVVISFVAAGSLLFTNASINVNANVPEGQANHVAAPWTSIHEDSNYTYETVEKVSKSKATAKKGTFKTKHNTNVRTDAGTKYKVVTLAKKGSTATATHQKKVGKEVWYKVKVNGKSGWMLSTLLTPTNVAKATPKKAVAKASAKKSPKKAAVKKAAPKATASNGTFKVKHNSNIRSNAGTNNKIVTLAKKGATVTSTAQKKVGSQVWYQVKANGKTGWVSGTLLTKTTVTAKAPVKKVAAKKTPVKKASNTATNSKLINNAKALIGTPYRFGGSTKSGFDCSGFVQYVFNQTGKNISRSTLTQFAESTKVSTPQAGDLVFFAGTYRAGISHVGIYIGNNQFIHAGGSKTEIRSLNDSYWKKHFHSYKRR